MSHDTYNSHVKSKRQEIIQFRNELMNRFTNPLAKIKQRERESRKHNSKSKSSMAPQDSQQHQMKSKPQIETYPWVWILNK